MKKTALALLIFLAAASPAFADWVYVCDRGSNRVDIIDSNTDMLIKSVIVGPNPMQAGYVQMVNKIYVTNSGAASISVISTVTNTVVNTINLGALRPRCIDVAIDDRFVYVSAYDGTNPHALKIRTIDDQIVSDCLIPVNSDIAGIVAKYKTGSFVGSEDFAFVAIPGGGVGAGEIRRVDFVLGSAVLTSGLDNPFMIDITPPTTMPPKLYVTSRYGATGAHLYIIDAPSGNLLNTLTLLSAPSAWSVGVRINKWGKAVVSSTCPMYLMHQVDVIDTATDTNMQTIPIALSSSTDELLDLFLSTSEQSAFLGMKDGANGDRVGLIDPSFAANPIWSHQTGPAPFSGVAVPPPPPPTIEESTPGAGPVSGGNVVILHGHSLAPGSSVYFGSNLSPNVNFIDPTALSVVVPSNGSPGFERIYVYDPSGMMAEGRAYYLYSLQTQMAHDIFPGSMPEQYRMLSVPGYMNVAEAKAALELAFGPYNPGVWRAFRWEQQYGFYREFADFDFIHRMESSANGKAIWILSKNGGQFNPVVFRTDIGSDIEVTIEPGWEQIGTPIPFPVDWNRVLVTDGSNSPVHIADAANVFVEPYLITFWNGAYYGTTVMKPFDGYWVLNKHGGRIYLIFPQSAIMKSSVGEAEMLPLMEGNVIPPPPPGGMKDENGGGGGGGGGCYVNHRPMDSNSGGGVIIFVALLAIWQIANRLRGSREKIG